MANSMNLLSVLLKGRAENSVSPVQRGGEEILLPDADIRSYEETVHGTSILPANNPLPHVCPEELQEVAAGDTPFCLP